MCDSKTQNKQNSFSPKTSGKIYLCQCSLFGFLCYYLFVCFFLAACEKNSIFQQQFCSLKHVKRCLKKKKREEEKETEGGEGNLTSNCLELNLTSFTCSSSHTTNICSSFRANTVYTHTGEQPGPAGSPPPTHHTQGRAAATNTNWPLCNREAADLGERRTVCAHTAALLPPADIQSDRGWRQ